MPIAANAFKRGEGVEKVPLDVDDAEERLALENYQSLTPDEAFDKRCLMSVFEEIFGEIEAKYRKRNELEIYRAITPTSHGVGNVNLTPRWLSSSASRRVPCECASVACARPWNNLFETTSVALSVLNKTSKRRSATIAGWRQNPNSTSFLNNGISLGPSWGRTMYM